MAKESRVAVVVDSAASLPADMGPPEKTQLYVVPMQLFIEGKTYRDGRDLKPAEFYRMLQSMAGVPTTSGPSPADFLDAFRAAAQGASSVLCLTVSPRFSSTYYSALAAAQEAKEAIPQVPIVVLNTESAAGSEGLIAMQAWRAAQQGGGLQEVVAAAQEVMSKVSLLAFLDTLYYVWKSGRVPKVAYLGTSLLQIKPLFELYHGEIRSVARARTTPRATERLLKLMRQRVRSGRIHATVMHADALAAAEQLRQKVEAEFTCEEMFISEFSPVMGTHTGPGVLGVAFWTEATESG